MSIQGHTLMSTVQRIIDAHGGLDALQALKITRPPYMALCIEKIGTGPRDLPLVSVAHYYQQNGDAMRNPDMTFEIGRTALGLPAWLPVSYRQDGLGIDQQAIFQDEQGRVMIRPRLIKDLAAFAKTWNRNLHEQGFDTTPQEDPP